MARERHWLRLTETLPDPDGELSEQTVSELVRGFNHTRQETRAYDPIDGKTMRRLKRSHPLVCCRIKGTIHVNSEKPLGFSHRRIAVALFDARTRWRRRSGTGRRRGQLDGPGSSCIVASRIVYNGDVHVVIVRILAAVMTPGPGLDLA